MSDSPFDFFRQETSNIDVEIRTEAMKKVALIAALMGPDKSRNEMLPYLLSNTYNLTLSVVWLLISIQTYINSQEGRVRPSISSHG